MRIYAKDLKPELTLGQLTLKRVVGKNKYGSYLWECRCSCGNLCTVISSCLSNGHTKSCGCLQKRRATEANITHGQTYKKVYWTWGRMLARCNNPKDKNYFRYGGRGIKVCRRWETFENFLADMGHPPSANHSIDRKDPNKGYYPKNCQWATSLEQARSRRDNVWVEEPDGSKLILKDWAAKYGVSYKGLSKQICTYGLELAIDRARKRATGIPIPRFITRGEGLRLYK